MPRICPFSRQKPAAAEAHHSIENHQFPGWWECPKRPVMMSIQSIPNALNPMALPTTPILGRMSTHSSPGGLMQFGRPFRRSAGHALLCRFSKTASILWPTFRHPLPSRAPVAIPRFACPLLLLAKSPFNPIPIASGGQGHGKRAAPKTAGGQPFSAIPSHIRAPCPPPGRMR